MASTEEDGFVDALTAVILERGFMSQGTRDEVGGSQETRARVEAQTANSQ